MATCAILGQALGTAVAMAVDSKTNIESIDIVSLQQKLMADDCYIPFRERNVPELSKKAVCSHDIIRNGKDRGDANCLKLNSGEVAQYHFEEDEHISQIRLVFDSNLNRAYQNMPCSYPIEEKKFKLPDTLIKEYIIEGCDKNGNLQRISVKDNHQRFVMHDVDWCVSTVRFIPVSTHGCSEFRIFDFELK